MKLKYYLRGLGMGIIFATILMTVSSMIHNNNLSEETIIKEARKLGMVMPEDLEDTEESIWADSEDDSLKEESEETENSESVEASEYDVPETEIMESESQTAESEMAEQVSTENEAEPEYVRLTIVPSEGAGVVADKLYRLGVIQDEDDFRNYLKETGIATRIRSGNFDIPIGATYEEICDIILRKTN